MFNKEVAQRLIAEIQGVLATEEVQSELEDMRSAELGACCVDLPLIEDWSYLGSGNFSQVWKHKELEGCVIKVGLKKEDSGAAYAAFCRDRPCKFYPEILHIESNKDAYFVVMPEYLSMECYDYDSMSEIRKMFWKEEESYFHHKEYSFLPSRAEKFDMIYGEGAASAARAIVKFFQDIATIDMHRENVMFDPRNNCIVYTDPVSFTRN